MKCFNNIIECSTKCSDPWTHYEVNNFFTEEYMDKLHSVIEQLDYTDCDTEKNRYEFMYSRTNYKKHDFVKDFIDQFRSDGADIIKQMSPVDLSNKLLRISLWKDTPGYTLRVHTDATYKLFTLQVYLPVIKNESMGTRFYDNHKREIKTRPYIENTGYFFFPDPQTGQSTLWHGFPEPFNDLRMSFMINIFDPGIFLEKMQKKNMISGHRHAFSNFFMT